MDAENTWANLTQWLGGPEDSYRQVIDYDGESLKVSYRKTHDVVVFDSYGEGGVYLSREEARQFLLKALDLLDRVGQPDS